MKKTLVFVMVVGLFVCSGFAQSGNVEKGIIGTWTDNVKDTWVFSDGGKLKYGDSKLDFSVVGMKVAMVGESEKVYLYEASLSSDGRTLILANITGNMLKHAEWGACFLLTKK